MAENIIRQDIIEIGFNTDIGVLTKINEEIDDLRKSLGVVGDADGLSEIKKQAEDATKSTKKMTDEMQKFVKTGNDGLERVKKQAEETVKPTQKLREELRRLAGIGMEKLNAGLKKTGQNLSNLAKRAASVSFKAIVTGLAATATGLGYVTKQSVAVFADYEQLIGGVETLFKDSAPIVEGYADNAYKSAGLSANAYMETVTGFSASLLQSLGGDTQAAAKLADVAISDMADNANKMGTGMEMIQDAYQGFAKQNYTMLDNLKLGYGGTKTEMERLVKDAAKLDKSIDANSMSYANIVKAIHAVQVEMGIFGTTQKEAEYTITGSYNAMKSAWGNLLTAFVVGGDSFDRCIDNMIDSVVIFGRNIMPAIEASLTGLGAAVERLTPIIAAKLPDIINNLLPPLINAAGTLVAALVRQIPTIIKASVPALVNAGAQIIKALYEGMTGKQMDSDMFSGLQSSMSSIIPVALKFIPVALGIAVALKAIRGIAGVAGMFGKSSSKGGGLLGGLGKSLEKLGKSKSGKIVKGMANLAIIVGGFTVLTAACMGVMGLVSLAVKPSDMLQIVGVIGALGAVGAGLSKLTGIVGKISPASILKGLLNVGLVIGGMSALLVLVGTTTLLGFDLNKIMQTVKIIGALGIVGGALSGFAGVIGLIPIPVVLAGLANMALVVGGMSAIILAFGALSEIKGFNEFITKGGETLANLFGQIGNIAGSLVGGFGAGVSDALPKIGENISTFAESLKPLFSMVKGVDMAGVGAFFTGVGGFLLKLSGNKIADFFTGGTDFTQVGSNLTDFAVSASGFFAQVATYPANSFTNAGLLFQAFGDMGNVPDTGGENIRSLGSGLKQFSVDTQGFFAQVETINIERMNQLWESLKKPGEITTNIAAVVSQNISDIVSQVSQLPQKMGAGIRSSGKSLSNSLVAVWKQAARASAAPVNKVIAGANWILKQFGSNKKIVSWKPYAAGTGGHPGGNALVNDGNGAELVQMPNGRTFIPQGRNVFIPNAPRGMKVLPAEQTARLMGRKSPAFHYAKGTDDIDVWNYADNPVGLVNRVSDKYVSYDGMKGLALYIGKGMVNTIKGQMSAWVKKLFDEMGGMGIGSYVASKGVEQWRSTVIKALQMEGQYSSANVARTLMQMQSESGGNPLAINLWDINARRGTPSKGLMQVIDPTFRAYARPGYNTNIWDPLSNILASVRYAMARYGSLARAYRGVGYANGGLITKPHVGMVGEAGSEMIIPLSASKRQRGLSLWQQAGEMMGADSVFDSSYCPDGDAARYTTTQSVEYNNVSPVFNLTINSSDDSSGRVLERKIKRWVKECIEDTFEMMERKNPRLQEI